MSKRVRILSIDVAIRTLAVCVVSVDPASELPASDSQQNTTIDTTGDTEECTFCHPKWAHMRIEHWSSTDILKMHGCRAKKITSVPSERLMNYMLNYFQQLMQEVDSDPENRLTHVLIERQHSQNKLSRYMSMCLYTFFYGYSGYSLKPRGKKGLQMVKPKGEPHLQYVHAKHKLSVLPVIGESCVRRTPKMSDYDFRKVMAETKVERLMQHLAETNPDRFQTALQFWNSLSKTKGKTRQKKDDPADALLMALYVIEHCK